MVLAGQSRRRATGFSGGRVAAEHDRRRIGHDDAQGAVIQPLDTADHVDRVCGLDEGDSVRGLLAEHHCSVLGAVVEDEPVLANVQDEAADADRRADHGGEIGEVGIGDRGLSRGRRRCRAAA